MMSNLLSKSQLYLKRNAPTILTCVGGVGVVATAVTAAKATPKAMRMVEFAEAQKGESLTRLEKFKVAGPVYIPSAVLGVSTLACIFGANALNKRQQAALMSAYAMLDSSYKEYKKKVKELHGDEAANEVVRKVAEDKYNPAEVKGDGKELFYDEFSGRFFKSTIEEVQRAEYNLNRDLVLRDWVNVNEFYDYLGLDHVDGGDKIGWSTYMNMDMYWQSWIDFSNSKTKSDDGKEYYIVTMFQEPIMDFENYIY